MSTNVKQFIANNKVLATVDNYPIKSITLGEDEYILNYDLNINYDNSTQSNVSSNFDRTKVIIRTEDRTIIVGNTSYYAQDKSGYEFKGWEYNGETVSGNIEFYPLEDVSITALWESSGEPTVYKVSVGVSGFVIGANDYNRVNISDSAIIEGVYPYTFEYTLEQILPPQDDGVTGVISNLERIGATTSEYADAVPNWSYGATGASEPPLVMFEKNLTFTGTFEQDIYINYAYVYEYTDEYGRKTYFK